ncbi:MAG: polyphosphate kinase 1 [Burkholderiaceae bacterium]
MQTLEKTATGQRFLNRELGVLAFNERVFAQAEDPSLPLLERLRFLCITSSNLDEFFEIRIAGMKEQILQNPGFRDVDGHTVSETYQMVSDRARELVARQYELLNSTLLPALEAEGVFLQLVTNWNDEIAAWARDYFHREILPVLTPIGLDPAHPFPRVLNKSLNFAVELGGKDAFGRNSGVAIVQAPRALPRLIRLPDGLASHPYSFVMLTSIMQACVADLFAGMQVHGCHQFRVTRNSDLFVDDEEITNLRVALQGELPQRHFGDAVRLEISATCSEAIAQLLMREFVLEPREVYRVSGPVNLVRLIQLPDLVDRADLKFSAFSPGLPNAIQKAQLKHSDFFKVLAKQDILLHHPYQSFNPVLDFLRSAAADPAVVAIKQTIYRTGTDSALMEALLTAARSGKEVTVVVELMARFDEETNINWAARLEQVGAHVVYGVVGHKTHAKMALVVRGELTRNGVRRLKRYAHLGTGNYHPRTARLYTDFGLFTANEDICSDVHEVFQQLTGLGSAKPLAELWHSPFTLHDNTVSAIRREAKHARSQKPARIIAKMNALLEPEVIAELYLASQSGVKIDLVVRGVCALRPGVPGLSENITVRSIIGRFLEHSRIFYFHNDGAKDVYLSSADWMDRNFFRRVELCFPVRDPKLKKRVIQEGLLIHLRDNVLAWEMDGDGAWTRVRTRAQRIDGQKELLDLLAGPH